MNTLTPELEARYQERLVDLLNRYDQFKDANPDIAKVFLERYANVHAELCKLQGY